MRNLGILTVQQPSKRENFQNSHALGASGREKSAKNLSFLAPRLGLPHQCWYCGPDRIPRRPNHLNQRIIWPRIYRGNVSQG